MSRAVRGGLLCIATLTVGSCMRHRPPKTVSAAADCGEPSGPVSQLRVIPGERTQAVRGVVVYSATGEPLDQVSLWMDSVIGKPVVTAADGRFSFPVQRVGRHQIVMRRVGVRGLRDTIEVPVAGELRLEAAPPPFDSLCGEFGSVYVGKPQ